MMKFKICGLREVGHALVAAETGADFLGFVFVPGVRRQLSEQEGCAVIHEYRRRWGSGGPKLVGLFADQPLDVVNRLVESCGLDMAQLCGQEPPGYWGQVAVPVIKQVRVRGDVLRDEGLSDALHRVDTVVRHGCIPLLDRHEAGSLGGTGRTFDWAIAEEITRDHDFLLAGGLSPDNVGQAIATVNPWGVDVSSGVETDCVKDTGKIVAFAQQVVEASKA